MDDNLSKKEQVAKIKNGNGIQFLLDESYKILGNPINIFDTDYKLMAYTDVYSDDPLWNELITTGTFSLASQIFFMNEGFTDDVANAEKLVILKSVKLKYDRIVGHIFNGHGIKVANVMMLECNKAFGPDTATSFAALADLITNEIRNDGFYITYGEAYQDMWIKRLIDYDLEEKELYSPHVQILYNGFKNNLYLSVVDITRSNARHNGHKYFVELLRQKRKDYKYAIYNNYIVIILSTNYNTFSIKRELKDIAVYFEQENIFAGISSGFENLFELRRYYAEAVKALQKLGDTGKHISITPELKYGKNFVR